MDNYPGLMEWPLFHNGVAAGLSIMPGLSQVTANHVIFVLTPLITALSVNCLVKTITPLITYIIYLSHQLS